MRSGTKAGIIGGTVAAVLLVAIVPTALYLTGNKQDNLVI